MTDNAKMLSSSRDRSLIRKLLFSLVPVTVLLLVTEITARWCMPLSSASGRRFEQIEEIIVYLGNQPGQSIFEPDPDCFWRLKPNVELPPEGGSHWGGRMSNSHGLHCREASLDEIFERRRVLCFGDSSTFAFGVPIDAAWPNQLHEDLDRRNPGEFEVLNAGIPGQTTYQGRQRLRCTLEKWRPSLAFITFGNNDGWRWDGLADKEHGQTLNAPRQWHWLKQSRAVSWLIETATTRMHAKQTQHELEWAQRASQNYFDPNLKWQPRVSLEDYRENLRVMIAECRAYDCEPVLVVWPDQRQLLDYPTWRLPYQQAVRDVAAHEDVRCVDLVPPFEGTGDWGVARFIPNDVIHVDRVGNEFVSQIMLRALFGLPTTPDSKAMSRRDVGNGQ